ncbi:hypothetical protein QR680_009886 [Steinernema hermaphroditum]|uniref:Uncharacterized protein n=1 Tax=Steinernema hermaphroditum TaxID=289476 RepID=A0AA39INN8_9BILA|nr:hypothetical protein QR680_009886 [Steinernema hermaphroditum]
MPHKFWSSEDAERIATEYFNSKATLAPRTIGWVRNEILNRHGLRFSKATIGLHLRKSKKPVWMTGVYDSTLEVGRSRRSSVPQSLDETITLDSDDDLDSSQPHNDIMSPNFGEEVESSGLKMFHRKTFWMTREGTEMLRKYVHFKETKAPIGRYGLAEMSNEIARKYNLRFSKTSLSRQVAIFRYQGALRPEDIWAGLEAVQPTQNNSDSDLEKVDKLIRETFNNAIRQVMEL